MGTRGGDGVSEGMAATGPTPREAVYTTISRYAVAVDAKDAAALGEVFADDAFADYTGALSDLNGGKNITAAVMASVAKLDTHHAISTVVIDLQSPSAASSIAYFTATLFGKGDNVGKHVHLYGVYKDTLQKFDGQNWKIKTRRLSFMGPMIGDTSILG